MEVEITGIKNGSFDFDCYGGDNVGVYGYDLVTGAGSNLPSPSNLPPSKAMARLKSCGKNFGFDLEQGITKVALDPQGAPLLAGGEKAPVLILSFSLPVCRFLRRTPFAAGAERACW